jgi:isopentenyl diphosphate isomerase/L-lactate dehydrogenase-like FMN-dependent dehydrogenase
LKGIHAVNIEALQRAAHRRLPRLIRDYLEGGAEDHVTVRANREVFEAIRFSPRTLVDVSQRSQKARVLGQLFDCPFGIAPLGAAGLFCHQAEIKLARAARAANVPFVLSNHSFIPVARVAQESGGPPWVQIYLSHNRDLARIALQRARDAGCEVIVLTTDVPVGGNREYNIRNGFGMPLRLSLRNTSDALLHPAWFAGVFLRLWFGVGTPALLAEWGIRHDTVDWDHFAWLRDAWRGKLLVKGILAVEDAQLAAQHGADGIIVSNHGGRQLDGAPSPMEVLPQIASAVGDQLAIAVDGGFRRGADIVKALALGADLVFVGRPALYGAAAGDEAGVRRTLQILKNEVDRVLALLGCRTIEELGPPFLRYVPRELGRPLSAVSLAAPTPLRPLNAPRSAASGEAGAEQSGA